MPAMYTITSASTAGALKGFFKIIGQTLVYELFDLETRKQPRTENKFLFRALLGFYG
jgi:hypothetical protein